MEPPYRAILLLLCFCGLMGIIGIVKARRRNEKTYYSISGVAFLMVLAVAVALLNQFLLSFAIIIVAGLLRTVLLPKAMQLYGQEIVNFERGVFLYTANDKIIKFDKFAPTGKPFELKPKPQVRQIDAPKVNTIKLPKMPFLFRIIAKFAPKVTVTESKTLQTTKWSENLDESEELEDEREWEEFLIEEEEWE